jgi:hypothetical protein
MANTSNDDLGVGCVFWEGKAFSEKAVLEEKAVVERKAVWERKAVSEGKAVLEAGKDVLEEGYVYQLENSDDQAAGYDELRASHGGQAAGCDVLVENRDVREG